MSTVSADRPPISKLTSIEEVQGEFERLLATDPLAAGDMFYACTERIRNIAMGKDRGFVEAIAGGPNPGPLQELLDTADRSYVAASAEARAAIVDGIVQFLRGCGGDNLPIVYTKTFTNMDLLCDLEEKNGEWVPPAQQYSWEHLKSLCIENPGGINLVWTVYATLLLARDIPDEERLDIQVAYPDALAGALRLAVIRIKRTIASEVAAQRRVAYFITREVLKDRFVSWVHDDIMAELPEDHRIGYRSIRARERSAA
jgi:hypothetical protein